VWSSNLGQWLRGSSKNHELRELRAAWDRSQAIWQASPIAFIDAKDPVGALALEINKDAWNRHAIPNVAIAVAMGHCIADLLSAEAIGKIKPKWDAIEGDVSAAVEFRSVVAHRTKYASDFARLHGAFRTQLQPALDAFFEALSDFFDDRHRAVPATGAAYP